MFKCDFIRSCSIYVQHNFDQTIHMFQKSR